MTDINRKAEATWNGDLRHGDGSITAESKTLQGVPFTFKTRFEESMTGTNPEELLAASHAACFSMAFANQLSSRGYKVDHVTTNAICHLSNASGGWKVEKMTLETSGKVEGVDQATFASIAQETDEKFCPISAALRAFPHEVKATLA
jgi:osmotically inducible protein OsmC